MCAVFVILKHANVTNHHDSEQLSAAPTI